MLRIYVWIGLAWLLLPCACDNHNDPARELERRILAPCCYRQALEDHESPLARMLRAEIERRIAAGEAAEHVESDLVRRYGDHVRAAPPARWAVVLVVVAALIAGMLLVVRLTLRRAVRGSVAQRPAAVNEDSPYADQLDDELAAVD